MTKRDDRVGLVDMLVYAEEAIEILGETGLKAMVGDRTNATRFAEIGGELWAKQPKTRFAADTGETSSHCLASNQRNEKSPGSCLRPSGSQRI